MYNRARLSWLHVSLMPNVFLVKAHRTYFPVAGTRLKLPSRSR